MLAGPNGAGKTTAAPYLLRDTLQVSEFVNADVIAQGLSGFDPQGAGIDAGRILLKRVQQLSRERIDFAFETTLASRSFAPFLRGLRSEGYSFRLVFLWLQSADMAVERVALRARMGGHFVPEVDVRRRYHRGLRNFFDLYRVVADTWTMLDNTHGNRTSVAHGFFEETAHVDDFDLWYKIKEEAAHG